jgi:hypothetical protein
MKADEFLHDERKNIYSLKFGILELLSCKKNVSDSPAVVHDGIRRCTEYIGGHEWSAPDDDYRVVNIHFSLIRYPNKSDQESGIGNSSKDNFFKRLGNFNKFNLFQ